MIRGLTFLSVVFFSACSLMPANTSPSAPLILPDNAAFTLDARFSLALAKERGAGAARQFSGRLFWRHEAGRDEWLLSDPFGQGIARLVSQPGGGFMLEQGGQEEFIGNDALEARVGFPLPLAELSAWARARAGSGAIVEYDDSGRLKRARESGWLLIYRYANDADRLPSQLEASLEEFRLKLAIERWDIQ
ncbi:MAG: outer membrane lipoprotein LolB [Betaproteobacteria bacterium]|nr:outer membrane lipoprotein LolB [Betaproteobacteria bacterium]